MENKTQTKFIAFSSQKGGVGKSTFTILTASILHYRFGYNVVVFDADFPQHSLIKMKERDLEIVMKNEVLKRQAYKQFSTIGKKVYPIIQHKAEGVLEAASKYIEESEIKPDIVFFDLPGTVNTPGILNALAGMHHIFTPITADRFIMESSLVFSQLIQEVIMKRGDTSLKSVQLFWNQVDGRERTILYEVYNDLIFELGLRCMKSIIKSSARFRKESELTTKNVFRSTILPPDQRLMKISGMEEFIKEFIEITELGEK